MNENNSLEERYIRCEQNLYLSILTLVTSTILYFMCIEGLGFPFEIAHGIFECICLCLVFWCICKLGDVKYELSLIEIVEEAELKYDLEEKSSTGKES